MWTRVATPCRTRTTTSGFALQVIVRDWVAAAMMLGISAHAHTWKIPIQARTYVSDSSLRVVLWGVKRTTVARCVSGYVECSQSDTGELRARIVGVVGVTN